MKWLLGLLFISQCYGAALTPVVVSAGSNAQTGGDFFPTACDGNPYYLVEKVINAYVVKAYFFLASPAPAMDAWLYSDTFQIIGEVHQITSTHPVTGLRYWESERSYYGDSIWVGKVWILVMCYPQGAPTSVEPYAIVYTRKNP